MKIAYLGPKGSFSHHVVQTAFPHEELEPFKYYRRYQGL